MAVDMYVRLTPAVGKPIVAESQDKQLKGDDGWFQVTQWGFKVNQPATGWIGSGSGGGKAKTENIQFKKQTDKASNTLIQYCCKGTHFKTVELLIRKSTGDSQPQNYIKLTMAQVVITDYEQTGSAGEGDTFEENITVSPRTVWFDYKAQLPDGTLDKTIMPARWDFAANSEPTDSNPFPIT